jgi:hypothetical protein
MAASDGIEGIGVIYFTRVKLCKDSREITAQRVAGLHSRLHQWARGF